MRGRKEWSGGGGGVCGVVVIIKLGFEEEEEMSTRPGQAMWQLRRIDGERKKSLLIHACQCGNKLLVLIAHCSMAGLSWLAG